MASDDILLFEDADFDMDVDVYSQTISENEQGSQDQNTHREIRNASDSEDEDMAKDMEEEIDGDNDEENSRSATIHRLEELILDFLAQLVQAMPNPKNSQPRQGAGDKVVIDLVDRRKPVKDDGSLPTRQLVFPQRGKHVSSRPIAQFLRIVDLIHEALTTGTPTNKRDMYYKDVSLFGSQAVVDRLVDDVAATLGTRRSDLNVRAASKGLMCGKGLKLHTRMGDIIELSVSENTLIPPSEEIGRYEVEDNLAWVLVVEKEAVFQTLAHLQLAEHPDLPGPGLLITGKGYPDVATRQLVCTLSENLPMTVPILALVDCDPYGIDILSVYKYGSVSMSHEQESLVASRITWAGVKTEDIAELGLDYDALIPITKHDQKKALAMLRRSDLPRKWRRELQYMLHSRRKAEIEILSSNDTALAPFRSEATTKRAPDASNRGPSHATGQKTGLLDYVVKKINWAINKSSEKFGS